MTTVLITTQNAEMCGWHTISDDDVAELQTRAREGTADIYDETYLANCRAVSLTKARKIYHAIDSVTGERL